VSQGTGSTITFSYNTNRTDVTDRNGNVIRYHYSGRDVTKVEQWISGASAFATNYTYSGGDLITIVKPLGNRIDFTVNGNGQVTERRQKETNTGSSSASDIVESWAYTSNFVTSYTDPRGYTTTYTRDAAGNVTAINYPTVTSPTTQSSVSKAFTYNARGQKTQATDEEGKIVEYSYYASGSNKYGLLWKVKVDPSGLNLVTEYLYNGQAQLQSIRTR
jgi:YD repeat-containing protein